MVAHTPRPPLPPARLPGSRSGGPAGTPPAACGPAGSKHAGARAAETPACWAACVQCAQPVACALCKPAAQPLHLIFSRQHACIAAAHRAWPQLLARRPMPRWRVCNPGWKPPVLTAAVCCCAMHDWALYYRSTPAKQLTRVRKAAGASPRCEPTWRQLSKAAQLAAHDAAQQQRLAVGGGQLLLVMQKGVEALPKPHLPWQQPADGGELCGAGHQIMLLLVVQQGVEAFPRPHLPRKQPEQGAAGAAGLSAYPAAAVAKASPRAAAAATAGASDTAPAATVPRQSSVTTHRERMLRPPPPAPASLARLALLSLACRPAPAQPPMPAQPPA